MTRCKVGDLAIIKDDGPYKDRIVHVVEYIGEHFPFGPIWRVESTFDVEVGQDNEIARKFAFPDNRLQPISGLPLQEDEQTDIKVPA